MTVPRLRVFAGPNGSGKSTMKSAIPSHLIGIYINPDEIEKAAKESGRLEFRDFQLEAEGDEVLSFIREHRLVKSAGLDEESAKIGFSSNGLNFQTVAMNSYFA
jgi:predicted ATPase